MSGISKFTGNICVDCKKDLTPAQEVLIGDTPFCVECWCKVEEQARKDGVFDVKPGEQAPYCPFCGSIEPDHVCGSII